ncbi:FAD-binding oxidoreductase [Halobellus sp. Atlit-38R]|uniref:FAD-binding oxidoreductase n=1 Tax=Halobellus sp. Atlit-38R TaxID=2282131 RepID=UPI000EF22364|nr:FAD-binding oxidoreductase [Halobellus sp. Atlit-38R]RLM90391.1 FAD-binding oxidoreductase [Halobellus sp. Atlit-38R]
MDANREARAIAASLPFDQFSSGLDGSLVTPTDDAYGAARRVWNGMVNEYPAAIAYCESTADVRASVAFAREHDVDLTVRSGGHSVSGASVASGALVVDCSRMEWVRVDPDGRTARVGPGATWGTVDRATQSFGLATPGGVFSDTGVAGLTLGGGTGYLSPKHGFTADNLRSVDVVTGEGERVTAGPDQHSDLFWAARGGGTPGVVTAFEFDLHPLDHDVLYFESWLPVDAASDALRAYREYQGDAPDEACVSPYFAAVPATADFPADRHGEFAFVLSGVYAGDPVAGRDEFAPFIDRADAFAASTDTMAYTDLQTMMDHDFPDGRHYFWKSVPLPELGDDAIDLFADAATNAPSDLSTVVVWPMHGAVERLPDETSPVVGRDAAVVVNVEAAWDDPMATPENVQWVRETCREFRALDSTPGTLPNFAGGSAPDAADVYATHADRLRRVRERYDPAGVFRYERE